MHELAEKIFAYVRREALLGPGDRVGVAVSGGADSIGLLCLLLECRYQLGVILSVVHLNHQLRGAQSDLDQESVARLAEEHQLEFYRAAFDVRAWASEHRVSLESAARELRYSYFAQLLGISAAGKAKLDKIVTGHTLDDQAETVLLRLMRGTGLRGLGGIQPRIACGSGEVVRPLLNVRRQEVAHYLNSLGQSWREDASNIDPQFTRNRIRHQLLPLLATEFNPSIKEQLAELAEIAQGEEDYWQKQILTWMGTVIQPSAPGNLGLGPPDQGKAKGSHVRPLEATPVGYRVDLRWLRSAPLAVERRALQAMADEVGLGLEFRHINQILRLASEERGTQFDLPLGWSVVHQGDALEFRRRETMVGRGSGDYEYRFRIPGEVRAPEAGLRLQVVPLLSETTADYSPDLVFDPSLLAKELVLRNWRHGDRFWPAHTKSPRKLKELFQKHHVPKQERYSWPVLVSGDQIIWVRGFPGRAHMRPSEAGHGVLLRAIAMSDE